MICNECLYEHVIEGQILVDGVILPHGWLECLIETMCKLGKFKLAEPEPTPLAEPFRPCDAEPFYPGGEPEVKPLDEPDA